MRQKIERRNAVPLYMQLAEFLARETKGLPDGSAFHGDRLICRRFKVSQPTARSALALLVKEGLVTRVPCKGTFVRKKRGNGTTGRKKNMIVGVISPLEAHFPHVMGIKGIENVASEYGYSVIISDFRVEDNPASIHKRNIFPSLQMLKNREPDGIIVISPAKREDDEAPPWLRNVKIPLILVNWSILRSQFPSVIADYEDGAYRLTMHLAESGYDTIGYIGGPIDRKANQDRFAGYKRALEKNRIQYRPEFVYPDNPDFRKDTGYQVMRKMFDRKEVPRAIFAARLQSRPGSLYDRPA